MYQAVLYPWERAIVSTGCQPKHFLTDPPPDFYLSEHEDKHSLEIISKYTNPVYTKTDSLPISAPLVAGRLSGTRPGTSTLRRNLEQSTNQDAGTLVLAVLNVRLGQGHHAHTTSMTTRIPKLNFPPIRGGLNRSTSLFLPAYGLLFKLPRRISKVQQQTI